MEQSPLRLIKRCAEFLEVERWQVIPSGLRGIYVLYKRRRGANAYDVVYVGMARAGVGGGMRNRIRRHAKRKKGLWTHFSIFEVWDNIRDEEIIELEGLFRHIYKRDAAANQLNQQRGFAALRQVTDNSIAEWDSQRAF